VTGDAEQTAERVRAAYARRDALGLESRYAYWEPANLFIYQGRERAILQLLQSHGILSLEGHSILDAGCGDGNVLYDFVRYGAKASDLTGVDLLPERIARATALLPGADLRVGDVQSLSFADASFDLVLAFTLLSSVVEPATRTRVCSELTRVLKPNGIVLIYDFWINPFNRDTRPVSRAQLRRLFPGRKIVVRSVTLAPPIVRVLGGRPGGWFAASALEMLPFLRTHLLAAVLPVY
jgi:ubiquinone/menaquinone biosynthesis C-methylase UbiE